MEHGDLPEDLVLQRTTPELDAESVPAGLLRAHRLAEGVWGRLEVTGGSVLFVWETDDERPVDLTAGDTVVIGPGLYHHVEPAPDARFVVEFYR